MFLLDMIIASHPLGKGLLGCKRMPREGLALLVEHHYGWLDNLATGEMKSVKGLVVVHVVCKGLVGKV